MWGKHSISSEGKDLDDAATKTVGQHYGENRSISDIENIVVEQNGHKIVITDRDEIQAFLEKYGQ